MLQSGFCGIRKRRFFTIRIWCTTSRCRTTSGGIRVKQSIVRQRCCRGSDIDEVPTVSEVYGISTQSVKTCDTRSKHLWRNYLVNAYFSGNLVNRSECSSRVGQPTIQRRTIPRIIDHHRSRDRCKIRVLQDSSVFITGNAGAPSLLQAYVGPGSTLSNAFVSGFVAKSCLKFTNKRVSQDIVSKHRTLSTRPHIHFGRRQTLNVSEFFQTGVGRITKWQRIDRWKLFGHDAEVLLTLFSNKMCFLF